MPRFVIERDIPGVGASSTLQCGDIARRSNEALRLVGSDIRWQHSYLADNKTFCVYDAASEELIHEHARRSGFPVTRITPVIHVLDPSMEKHGD